MIRTARFSDVSAIAEIYRLYVVGTWISFEDTPPDENEIGARLAELKHFPWLVSESQGRVEGYAYASSHRSRAAYRWSVDVTAYVRDGLQRRGVGRQLYESLLPLLGARKKAARSHELVGEF
jgi:phosphinothricin acetyltransferase